MENLYQIPSRDSCSAVERERLWKQIIADQERKGSFFKFKYKVKLFAEFGDKLVDN